MNRRLFPHQRFKETPLLAWVCTFAELLVISFFPSRSHLSQDDYTGDYVPYGLIKKHPTMQPEGIEMVFT
jgi:hypothetical protein